jgi:hypothetical protein
MADDDKKGEGKETGEGTGGDDSKKAEGVSREEFTQLVGSVNELTKVSMTTNDGLSQLTQKLEAALTAGGGEDDEGKTATQEPSGAELEGMSRKDFGEHLINRMSERVEGLVGKIDNKVELSQQERIRAELTSQVKQAVKDHVDFEEWRPSIVEVMKRNPYLAVEEAYMLARAKEPDKAKELDAKYTKANGGEGAGSDGSKSGQKFGGMKSSSSTTEKNQRMEPKDAAEAAWDEAIGTLEDASVLTAVGE